MAMKQAPQLGCGETIDDIWAGIEAPPTAYQRSCPQCQAARESLGSLSAVVSTYHREEDSDDESMRPSSRVRENILAVARSEVRRSRRTLVAVNELGPVFISEQALVELIRVATDSTEGVRARRIEINTEIVDDVPGRYSGVTGTHRVLDTLTVRLAVGPKTSIPQVTARVRERVLAVLARHVDADPAAVDLVVEDVFDA